MLQSESGDSPNHRVRPGAAALVALGLGLIPLAAALVISRIDNAEVSDATRDAVDVLEAPAYIGFVSNLGVVSWVVAATSCLFAAAVLAARSSQRSDVRFLAATGLLTALAAVDDMFLIHERVITPLAGGSESAYAAVWALLLVAYAVVAGRSLLRYRSPLLFVVAALVVLSVGVDVFAPLTNWWTFIEDSAKYLAIVFWTVYLVPLSFGLALDAEADEGN